MNTSLSALALAALASGLSAQGTDLPTDPDTAALLGAGFEFSSRDGHARDGGWTSHRPDGHAPIGVMGDHLHSAGEWMVSLRLMRMHMEGMRNNTSGISNSDVFGQGFLVTPTEMDMDMLMLGGMYAPTDEWTLMLMVPYVSNWMNHETAMGVTFDTESEGLGDVRFTAMRSLYDAGDERVHLNLGVSLPTGSVDERDDTPAMANAKLPYPMQLGTGTFDFLPGITYLGQSGDTSWGAQGTLRFHLGENSEDYKHGNRQNVTGWIAQRLGQDLSGSLRLDFNKWENFHGADPDLNPAMVPTADPDLRGGDRLDALVGLNWNPGLGGNRLALEAGVPLYQDLDGPNLETDWIVTLGWQLSL